MQKTISLTILPLQLLPLKNYLKEKNWVEIGVKSDYEDSRFKSPLGTIVIYKSNKIVIQVQEENIEEVVKGINTKFLSTQNKSKNSGDKAPENAYRLTQYSTRIGCDEAGKGEYFGPLVTASCLVNEELEQKLITLGVKDSKKIKNGRVFEIADEIKRLCKYEVSIIMPEEYNRLHKEGSNASEILAISHGRSINSLIDNYRLSIINYQKNVVIVDKFTPIKSRIEGKLDLDKIQVFQIEKGERDIAVASASILARAEYLRQIELIEKELNLVLPKGYNKGLKSFVGLIDKDVLNKIAKISFKVS